MIKISETGKLDGIKSWSLQAIDTCPGSIGADGELVDPCKLCYARGGAYTWKTTIAPREENRKDWKRPEWVADMVARLSKEKFFRLFDSGDLYSVSLARKWLEVFKSLPNCKFWLPTRAYKFDKFQSVLAEMNALPNVSVRYSSDSVIGEYTPGLHGSTILHTDDTPAGVTRCMAYTRGGKCGGCRACWDKSVPVIGYPFHGKAKCRKVIQIALARTV